jgi:hypothetical protein
MLMLGISSLSVHAQMNEWDIEWLPTTATLWEWVDVQEKVHLNTSTFADLKHIGFTDEEASCIISHREEYGKWLHETELQQCPLSHSRIQELRPYIKPLAHQQSDPIVQLDYWLNPKIRYTNSVLYQPKNEHPLGHHSQIQLRWNTFSRLGFLTQTDAGERTFDFTTAAWEFKNAPLFTHLVLGRFLWNWNQGLVHNAPYAIGRSFDMGSWVNTQQELRPALTQNEDLGLWGAAITGYWKLGAWYASVGTSKFDARLNTEGNAFTQRHFGGIHVSPLERSRRHNNELQHIFGGVKINGLQQEIILSISHYRYHIPRFWNHQKYQQEHYLEGQYTTNQFLDARTLFNVAYASNRQVSWYLSSIKVIHSKMDIAFRSLRIPEGFIPPERSPFAQSDIGKSISEWGIDLRLSKKQILQARSTHEFKLYPQAHVSNDTRKNGFQLQYIYQNKTSEFFQFRIRQSLHYSDYQPLQCDAAYRFNLTPKWQVKSVFQWKERHALEPKSSIIQFQISVHERRFTGTVYGAQFHTQESSYILLPSAQYPWRLGVFNGKGSAFGIIGTLKLHTHLKCRFSFDWINYHNLKDQSNQKPRIFVQLEL